MHSEYGIRTMFLWAVVGLLGVQTIAGCAIGGQAVASGAGSGATGGAAMNVVSISPSIALGDAVAKAASDAANAYLKTLSLPANAAADTVAAAKKTAVGKAVDAGTRKAQEQGKAVSEADKQELARASEAAVDAVLPAAK